MSTSLLPLNGDQVKAQGACALYGEAIIHYDEDSLTRALADAQVALSQGLYPVLEETWEEARPAVDEHYTAEPQEEDYEDETGVFDEDTYEQAYDEWQRDLDLLNQEDPTEVWVDYTLHTHSSREDFEANIASGGDYQGPQDEFFYDPRPSLARGESVLSNSTDREGNPWLTYRAQVTALA